ncbi:hypothetical protein BKA69DRAFT_1124034 [Paraphysoderma sedebokerense]|nr:hypothetical protein BKA69DRAFT_1124034 [Paraphysoderma sedebokerense]
MVIHQNFTIADGIFIAISLPFILTSFFITRAVHKRLQNSTSSSRFLQFSTVTWIVISISTITITLQPFLVPCQKAEVKIIVTNDKCVNWWFEILATVLLNLDIGLFSVGSLALSSMILRNSVTLIRIGQKTIHLFQFIVLAFLLVYTYTYIKVVTTESSHPELNARFELSFWLFAGSYGLAMLTCLVSAVLSLTYIYKLKQELISFNCDSTGSKFNGTSKRTLSAYIRRVWIYVSMFLVVIIIYLMVVVFRLPFPWTAMYIVGEVTAFGSMTGFQVNMLDLLAKGGQGTNTQSHLVSVRRDVSDAK